MVNANLQTSNYVDFEKKCLALISKLEQKKFNRQLTEMSVETDDLSLLSHRSRAPAETEDDQSDSSDVESQTLTSEEEN